MARFRKVAWLTVIVALVVTATLVTTYRVSANVTALALFRRSCGIVDAFVTYDGFSEGKPVFFVVFAVDLDGNGVYGEAGEPMKLVKVDPKNEQEYVGARLAFNPLPEGSSISVTAYELDSAGVQVSKQVAPVTYTCAHRPATDKFPADANVAGPPVGIVAKIRVAAVTVFQYPTTKSTPLGGLGKGAFVNALAFNQRGDWVQIPFKGQLGWIMWQTQVILFGPYSLLPRLPNAENYTPTPIPATPTPGG